MNAEYAAQTTYGGSNYKVRKLIRDYYIYSGVQAYSNLVGFFETGFMTVIHDIDHVYKEHFLGKIGEH